MSHCGGGGGGGGGGWGARGWGRGAVPPANKQDLAEVTFADDRQGFEVLRGVTFTDGSRSTGGGG